MACIVAPSPDDSSIQAILTRWYKRDGEQVDVDEPICELETDKASIDVTAPSAGILRQFKREGETVRIGEEVGRVDAI